MVRIPRPDAGTGAIACMLGVSVIISGCGIPRDPEQSLEAARGAELSAGAVHNPPWVSVEDGERPSGPEVDLIEEYAERIGAQVAWSTGSESGLVGRLHDRQLDVVIGGFDEHTVWDHHAAVTRPYEVLEEGPGRVVLIELGENALLHDLESHFITRDDS